MKSNERTNAVANAIANERTRAVAILREARALGIAEEHVNAALRDGTSVEEFVDGRAPVEALARQIANAHRLATGS